MYSYSILIQSWTKDQRAPNRAAISTRAPAGKAVNNPLAAEFERQQVETTIPFAKQIMIIISSIKLHFKSYKNTNS